MDKTFKINKNFYKIELEILKTEIFKDCISGISFIKEKEIKEIYLSLGSNIGDKLNNILKAYELLQEVGIEIIQKSKIIETKPMYVLEQDNFLNSVIKAKTFFTPRELLSEIEKIMFSMGRERIVKNGPRIIDIDILFYGDENINTEDLIIPHPKIQERDFVLNGLREVGLKI